MHTRVPVLTSIAALGLLACHHTAPGPPAAVASRLVMTVLAVEDLEASTAFYTQTFGWPVRVEAPVFRELALPDGTGLGLYAQGAYAHNIGGRAPSPAPAGPDGVTATELYLHVPDLSATIAALHAAGARELSPRALRPWGDEAAYFADPDGNVLAVATPAGE
jgi:catechol 2,3-dioxygenase-like lactoylglutathione lyase family enzyme